MHQTQRGTLVWYRGDIAGHCHRASVTGSSLCSRPGRKGSSVPRPNALLASLTAGDAAALQPHLRRVELQQKSVLYNAGDAVNAVYFPTSAVISLVVTLITGETTEAAMVGNDGAVGISSALDGRIALSQAVVQLGGEAMVCDPAAFPGAVPQSESLRSEE